MEQQVDVTTRRAAQQLDTDDELAGFRDQFFFPDSGLLYLDGNSLGRLPLRTMNRLNSVIGHEWGARLIRGWFEGWMDLPQQVGDLIGEHFLGAAPGQVVLADSTTVNLYKLAAAAVDAADAGRDVIISNRNNFPTDRYVLEGIAARRGIKVDLLDLETVTAQAIAEAVGPSTALVALSHVDYRTGAIADMAAINDVVHGAGARVLWDLSHTAGSVPIELDLSRTDLAAGCTYKYLHGGPGAPAFLYVRADLQEILRPPIWGWFGQQDQFAMGQGFQPVTGIGKFVSGTPPVLCAAAIAEGVQLMAEAGIDRLRRKAMNLTGFAITLADAWLAEHGFSVGSPRDPAECGSHVALHHRDARDLVAALAAKADVIVDFREPDVIRLGLAPITTRFTDIWHALDRLRSLASGVASGRREGLG
jgi:kynureninase